MLLQFRRGMLDADQWRAISDAGERLGSGWDWCGRFGNGPRRDTLEALRDRLRAAPGALRVEANAP